ncbi:MAG: hypothetical protein MJZ63_09145, partial [Muribaculaceae bacterium]|nr:hypothetical protein [Muribaculaceae bacterium]
SKGNIQIAKIHYVSKCLHDYPIFVFCGKITKKLHLSIPFTPKSTKKTVPIVSQQQALTL